MLELLRRNDQAKHPKGETLPHDMRLYRFDLIQSFLTAGIPLSKIDCLRSFLEKYGRRLTSQSHLRELIPSVLQKEKETLKSELTEAKAVSTIFDGSTRLGEALAIIVRFVDSQGNVQQRLVRLQVLAKSLKAEELAQCLIQALAVEYAIRGCIFFQRKFSQEFYENVLVFRSARLCCPVQVQQLRPTAASVEELRRVRFLDNDAIIQGLTAELPRYLAVADGAGLQTEEEKLQWWSRNEANLPNCSSAVKKVLLVQPSSASAERVFSIMNNFFTNQQDAALEQTVEASVMLCYNQNQRNKLVVV